MTFRRRGRRTASSQIHRTEPLWRPSLAPLASVWMVAAALFMGVYTNPPHALLVDLPHPMPPGNIGVLSPIYNRVTIEPSGEVRWNGTVLSDQDLFPVLAAVHEQSPQPALLFDPAAETSFARSLAVMDIIRRQGLVDRCFIFAQTARYRRYEQRPDPDEPIPSQSTECMQIYQ